MNNTEQLISFLHDAAQEMANAYSLDRFMELRYSLLYSQFPHDVFSVNECSPDFFRKSLHAIIGVNPVRIEPEDAQYTINWKKWCMANAKNYKK